MKTASTLKRLSFLFLLYTSEMLLKTFVLFAFPLALLTFAPLATEAAGPCADGSSGHIATPAEVTAGALPGRPVCASDAAAGFTNDAGQAKEYLNSLPNKCVGGCQAPPDRAHINKLNNAFAICAAGFFKAYTQRYGQVSISSAYRDGPSGENARAGGVPGSNHTIGVAIDVNPANGNYQTMWGFAKANPQFGVCFPHEGNDRPHMVLGGIGGREGAMCAAKGVTKPCNGLSFVPSPASNTPPTLSDQIRRALGMQPPPPPQPPMAPQPQLPPQPQSQPQPTLPAQPTLPGQPTIPSEYPQIKPVSDLINTNTNTSNNTNTNTKSTSTATSTWDLIDAYLNPVSDFIDIGKAVDIALNPDTSDATALEPGQGPSTIGATGTLAISPSINAPQTFISNDLAKNPFASNATGQNTFVLQVLETMKRTLLLALEYLKPFGGRTPVQGYGE